MINLPTKFEVPSFLHYGGMKDVQKGPNWGGLGWLGVTQGHQKFEVSVFSRYGDMKCVKIHKTRVVWGG